MATDSFGKKLAIPTDIESIVSDMPLRKKIEALSGKFTEQEFFSESTEVIDGKEHFHYNLIPYPTGNVEKLGVSPVRFVDGPRGVVSGNSTCFPVSMSRGASFDPELEERIGEVIGREVRATGGNYFGGVCINILRHPAAGRAQETYGEDMHLLGEMGSALVRGVQRHNVMACVKHYACNNIENSRFSVNVELDDRTLHEVYLPHFQRCVDEGAASFMGAYNKVRGDHCCESTLLLTDILRTRWGFEGFVVSDFLMGVRNAAKAMNAGLDIEMPSRMLYIADLENDVHEGRVSERTIDDALRRVLRTSMLFEQSDDPEYYNSLSVCSSDHIALARESARKGMVLLKNETAEQRPLLPIDVESTKNIALLGKLANVENIGDHGSSRVYPPYIVTPFQGIEKLANKAGIALVTSFVNEDLDTARSLAGKADVAIVVAGCTHADEGEYVPSDMLSDDQKLEAGDRGAVGGDRSSLRLRSEEINLIHEVSKANKHVILVLIGGSAFILEDVIDDVEAIVFAWYPGMEGGNAIGDVLFGLHNPGGKLPFTIPESEDQLALFSNEVDEIQYDYYHGYMLTDKSNRTPRFLFGYGLSYSSFRFGVPEVGLDSTRDAITIAVEVENTSNRAGDEVVQVYVGFPESDIERPERVLKAFKRTHLLPGQPKVVHLLIPTSELGYFDPDSQQFVGESSRRYNVFVGSSSAAKDLQVKQVMV